MNTQLTLGSLFDGSGGFPFAGLLCGIEPLWASEIEPFPMRVTTKRLPQMAHLGDVSKLCGDDLPPVDIITFGSPCTDLSIAGRRAGLDGKQSGLFHQAIRIINEMRCKTNERYPRYAVWENVPGAFSSNKGEDFRAVLEAFVKVKDATASVPMPESGKWSTAGSIVGNAFSLAWRTLDAQFFGVAQRRRRVFLVADFDGECAANILFECEGMSRNIAPSGAPWERFATVAESSVDCRQRLAAIRPINLMVATRSNADDERTAFGIGEEGDPQFTLGAAHEHAVAYGVKCLNDQGGDTMSVSEDISATLRAQEHGHQPIVFEPGAVSRLGGHYCNNISGTLRADPGDNLQAVTVPQTLKIRSGCNGGGKGALVQDNKSATLSCGNDQTVFVPTAYGICSDKSNSMLSDNPHSGIYEAQTSRTLDGNCNNPSCNQGGIAIVNRCYDTCENGNSDTVPTFVDKHEISRDDYSAVCVQGSMIGRTEENGPQGSGIHKDVSFTLNTVDRHAVAFAQDRYDAYSESNSSATLKACGGTYGGGSEALISEYAVRRLTPTECARLQGFPDDWCADLDTPNPTEDEIAYWTQIWEEHRLIIGKSTKPKSRKQIIKWLQHPHSDSAEYTMWGNGVALPCVCFVLMGIVENNR